MVTKWKGAKDWYQLLLHGLVIEQGEDRCAEFCIKAQRLGKGASVEAVKHPEHGYLPFGFWYNPSEGDIAWRLEYDRRNRPACRTCGCNIPPREDDAMCEGMAALSDRLKEAESLLSYFEIDKVIAYLQKYPDAYRHPGSPGSTRSQV